MFGRVEGLLLVVTKLEGETSNWWTGVSDTKCSPACGIVLPPVSGALPREAGVRVQLPVSPKRVPAFPSCCHGNSLVWNAGLLSPSGKEGRDKK